MDHTKSTSRARPAPTATETGRGEGDNPVDSFWDFSLSVYGRRGVAPAYLALQDRHGADVNVLLFCCWLGASGRGVLAGEDLDKALASARNWQEDVLVPLRRLRCLIKGAEYRTSELAERLAAVEIEAERVEQQMLERGTRRRPDPGRADKARVFDAAENLRRYLVALGVAVGGIERKDAAVLLKAVFPAAEPAEIEECCRLTLCGGR